jgi:hypothetical protein
LTAAPRAAPPKAGRDEGMVLPDRTKRCCFCAELSQSPSMTDLLNLTHTTTFRGGGSIA